MRQGFGPGRLTLDIDIPDKIIPAIRLISINLVWILPLIAIERATEGHPRTAIALAALLMLDIPIAVYWDRLLPRGWRRKTPPSLAYLHYVDSELGSAIRDMAWHSAWGKWYAAQYLALNEHKPITDWELMGTATSVVLDAVTNGNLEVRGRKPGQLGYEPISATHWRSTAFHMIRDNATIWKLILIPRGGAEISPEGEVIGSNKEATERTKQLAEYDSLIVNSRQFEDLWPRRDRFTDRARRKFLKQAKEAGSDPEEIKKLSRD